MASHILSVWGMRDFTDASRAASMGPFLERRYSSRLKDGAVADSLNTVRVEEEDVFEGTKAEAYCIDIAKSAALKQDKFIFS